MLGVLLPLVVMLIAARPGVLPLPGPPVGGRISLLSFRLPQVDGE